MAAHIIISRAEICNSVYLLQALQCQRFGRIKHAPSPPCDFLDKTEEFDADNLPLLETLSRLINHFYRFRLFVDLESRAFFDTHPPHVFQRTVNNIFLAAKRLFGGNDVPTDPAGQHKRIEKAMQRMLESRNFALEITAAAAEFRQFVTNFSRHRDAIKDSRQGGAASTLLSLPDEVWRLIVLELSPSTACRLKTVSRVFAKAHHPASKMTPCFRIRRMVGEAGAEQIMRVSTVVLELFVDFGRVIEGIAPPSREQMWEDQNRAAVMARVLASPDPARQAEEAARRKALFFARQGPEPDPADCFHLLEGDRYFARFTISNQTGVRLLYADTLQPVPGSVVKNVRGFKNASVEHQSRKNCTPLPMKVSVLLNALSTKHANRLFVVEVVVHASNYMNGRQFDCRVRSQPMLLVSRMTDTVVKRAAPAVAREQKRQREEARWGA